MVLAMIMFYMKSKNDISEREKYLIGQIMENQQREENKREQKRLKDLEDNQRFSDSMRGLDIDYQKISNEHEKESQKLENLEDIWAKTDEKNSETNSDDGEQMRENCWKEIEEKETDASKDNESLESDKKTVEKKEISEEKVDEKLEDDIKSQKSDVESEKNDDKTSKKSKEEDNESDSDKKSTKSQKDSSETKSEKETKENNEPDNFENAALVKSKDSAKQTYADFISSMRKNSHVSGEDTETVKTSEEFGCSEKLKQDREELIKKEDEVKKKKKEELELWTSKIMMKWPGQKPNDNEEKTTSEENKTEKDDKKDENSETQNNKEENPEEKPVEKPQPKVKPW